ncbi:MAG TPA: S-adenosylmethionine:tRNA ribosyltransferase-isomerase [Chitinophagaceae bacterium]|nr:S-adenosylmethionine:tRNA ribosyltransferase-isomerase [Chitinophagaceae bacterium]
MNDPRNISIRDFTYSLPEERIAKYPLSERDASKLLIYKDGKISEDVYKNITGHLPDNSLLILNNTKVVEARLLFQKPSGGTVEIFCLEPHEQYADITTAMLQKGKVWWNCLVGGASKWKKGQVLIKSINETSLSASYIDKKNDYFIIELSWKPSHLSFAEILHFAGMVPLPPYIKRKPEKGDAERYQTVYAEADGSVAAPTAGLHFTDEIFKKLEQKNIEIDFVTLHVGAGTFKPVKTERMQDHIMHSEWIDVSITTIKKLYAHLDGNIIAVGTTSLRTIESLYWIGLKTYLSPEIQTPELEQWDAYELDEKNVSVKDAFNSLLNWMEKTNTIRLVTKTRLLIAPGYEFKVIKALITNFHQPQSTLLLLVAALAGKDWRSVYNYALENNFRFLSYGDGSLLWKKL